MIRKTRPEKISWKRKESLVFILFYKELRINLTDNWHFSGKEACCCFVKRRQNYIFNIIEGDHWEWRYTEYKGNLSLFSKIYHWLLCIPLKDRFNACKG